MRRIIRKRSMRKRTVAGIVVAAALAGTASLAAAQVVPAPDGGPAAGGAAGPVTVTSCGASVGSTVITQDDPRTKNVPGFTTLPGTLRQFNVPAEQTRCIKVLFTAEAACGLSAGPDFCYVQALIDGVPMDPDGGGFQVLASEDGTASGNAYEWVKRVGPGAHTVELQWSVLAAGTQFWLDDWTFDVQQYL